jgi:hypothetical protein
VHNHPSGDPSPSGADIDMTKQVVEAARALKIAVHDHLVVGPWTALEKSVVYGWPANMFARDGVHSGARSAWPRDLSGFGKP